MIGDTEAEPQHALGAPLLKAILVAADGDVEQFIRSARAEIAMLSLELRTMQRDAESAERKLAGAPSPVDATAALDAVRAAAAERADLRRSELASDLARERAEAVAVVEAARVEAEAVMASARHDLVLALGIPPAAAPAAAPPPEPVVPVPAPVATTPEPVTPPPVVSERPSRSSHYLYVDVVLPMVAVLVIFVVLLAWLG